MEPSLKTDKSFGNTSIPLSLINPRKRRYILSRIDACSRYGLAFPAFSALTGCLLVLLCLDLAVNTQAQQQQPEKDLITKERGSSPLPG